MINRTIWKRNVAVFLAVGIAAVSCPVFSSFNTEARNSAQTEAEDSTETKIDTGMLDGAEAKPAKEAGISHNKTSDQLLGKSLKEGDCIGIAAPAGFIKDDDYNQALMFLKDMGYEVKLTKSCTEKDGLFAGSDRDRAEDVNALFEDDSVDAIMCLKGGYGCSRILKYLDYEMISKHPKLLIGYSDITALHTALIQRCGLVTVHGPMILSFRTIYSDYINNLFQKEISAEEIVDGYDLSKSGLFDLEETSFKGSSMEFTVTQFFSGLQSDEAIGEITLPEGEELKTIIPGSAEGRIVGGNLTVLTSLIGTENELQGDDAILFLEEVQEPAYRIDRMLQQLYQNGLLDRVSAIMIGDMSSNIDDENRTCEEVIEEYAKLAGKPCISGVPAGHGTENMFLPLNVDAKLTAKKDGSASLVILDPAARGYGD